MAPPPYRFTTYDLDSSIKVARVIWENGGLKSNAELAALLGYKGPNNGAFLTRVANAKLFGLVEGPSSALKPTERALSILQPDFPETADRARLEAFEDVPLFKAVLDQYDGQPLPSEEGLRNALETRWSIHTDKAGMVLSRLLESAEQAGLFRTTGNRSRMIRPTIGSADGRRGAPAPSDATASDPSRAATAGARGSTGVIVAGPRSNKIIDGALDLLPSDSDWDEDGLRDWLGFFESALRLYYRLPTPTSG